MTDTDYRIVKDLRRGPWNRMRNRRGGLSTIWMVFDSTGTLVAELFTKRSALAWIDGKREAARA